MTDVDTAVPDSPVAAARAQRGRAFAVWLALLRALAVTQAVVAIGQPLSIGQYLAGLYTWLGLHSAGAVALTLATFLLAVASIGYATTGGRVWVPIVCWLLLSAVQVQAGMGYARVLAVHVPLGVFVVTASVLLAIWSLRRGTGRARPRRTARVPAQTSPAGTDGEAR
jgi:hypothetical protein